MSQALEVLQPQTWTPPASVPPASNALTPMAMLSQAVANGASIDVVEKLMALAERMEGAAARKAFDEAVSAAKSEIPPVVRNRQGHNQKRYADFAAIAKVVDPIISKHGLSYRFRTVQTDKISVTCILAHKSGHFEENTLVGQPDATGNKNAIQAIGSALTYLMRYSLVQALGIAVADDDDGAAMAEDGPISEEELAELRELLDASAADIPSVCRFLNVESLAAISKKQLPGAMARAQERLATYQQKAGARR